MLNFHSGGTRRRRLGADRQHVDPEIGNVAGTSGVAACAGRMAGRWESGQAGERPGSAVSARGAPGSQGRVPARTAKTGPVPGRPGGFLRQSPAPFQHSRLEAIVCASGHPIGGACGTLLGLFAAHLVEELTDGGYEALVVLVAQLDP